MEHLPDPHTIPTLGVLNSFGKRVRMAMMASVKSEVKLSREGEWDGEGRGSGIRGRASSETRMGVGDSVIGRCMVKGLHLSSCRSRVVPGRAGVFEILRCSSSSSQQIRLENKRKWYNNIISFQINQTIQEALSVHVAKKKNEPNHTGTEPRKKRLIHLSISTVLNHMSYEY